MWISESLHTVTKKDTQCKIIRSNTDPRQSRLVSCLHSRPPHAPSPSGQLQLVMWRLDGTLAGSIPRQRRARSACNMYEQSVGVARCSREPPTPPTTSWLSVSSNRVLTGVTMNVPWHLPRRWCQHRTHSTSKSPGMEVRVENNGDSLRKRLARVETFTCIGVQRRMYSRRKCWDAAGR